MASGNCVFALVDDIYLPEAEAIKSLLIQAGMPEGVFQILSLGHLPVLLADSRLAGAVVDHHSALKQLSGEILGGRSGAIVPLITASSYSTLLERLVTEKTITIDTTAAGGNASLMTMESNVG